MRKQMSAITSVGLNHGRYDADKHMECSMCQALDTAVYPCYMWQDTLQVTCSKSFSHF